MKKYDGFGFNLGLWLLAILVYPMQQSSATSHQPKGDNNIIIKEAAALYQISRLILKAYTYQTKGAGST